jgi:hypothetical protein
MVLLRTKMLVGGPNSRRHLQSLDWPANNHFQVSFEQGIVRLSAPLARDVASLISFGAGPVRRAGVDAIARVF